VRAAAMLMTETGEVSAYQGLAEPPPFNPDLDDEVESLVVAVPGISVQGAVAGAQ
jgi:hypothetical protein